jgi:curli biogenesis system outer membrane secretion channel CsgG
MFLALFGCSSTPPNNSSRRINSDDKLVQEIDEQIAQSRRDGILTHSALNSKFAKMVLDEDIKVAILGGYSNWDDNLANQFTTAFLQFGWVIVERSRLKQVLNEHALSMSGVLEPEARHTIGRILGVNIIVFCTADSPYPFGQGSLKFIDVETGEVVGSSTFQWKRKDAEAGPMCVVITLWREAWREVKGR